MKWRYSSEHWRGILEYPKERKTEEIVLSERDRDEIKQVCKTILKIVEGDIIPESIKKGCCSKCSYFDFCFIGEV